MDLSLDRISKLWNDTFFRQLVHKGPQRRFLCCSFVVPTALKIDSSSRVVPLKLVELKLAARQRIRVSLMLLNLSNLEISMIIKN